MDFNKIALRVAAFNSESARKKPKSKLPRSSKKRNEEDDDVKIILAPSNEYSCRMELILSADFIGDSSKNALTKKLKGEILAAMETAVKITARDLLLDAKSVLIKPTAFDCEVHTSNSFEDE